jgi:hypothetical protein
VTNPPRYAIEPERSVPLAPLALALSLLVAPVGIVLGIVALRRARRDNEPGGTAVAAIAVGAVVTLAYVTLVVLLVVLFVELNHSTAPLPPGLA